MNIAAILDTALEDWLAAGAPLPEYSPRYYQPGHPTKVHPSQLAGCPARHAYERRGTTPWLTQERSVTDHLRMERGNHVAHTWFTILSHYAGGTWHAEVPFETPALTGALDILGYREDIVIPIEVKFSSLRLAWRYFVQAVAYASVFGSCTLILDRPAGGYDLVEVQLQNNCWQAVDLRTGLLFLNRHAPYMMTDNDLVELIAAHQTAYDNPAACRLASPTVTQCITVNRSQWQIICPWFCWGDPTKVQLAGEQLVVEGRPLTLLKATW